MSRLCCRERVHSRHGSRSRHATGAWSARRSSFGPGDTTASAVGEASDAVPTREGGAWLLRYENRRRCTIRKVGADGGERVPPRVIDCGSIQPSEGGGLILSRSKDGVLLDPSTGRVLLRA